MDTTTQTALTTVETMLPQILMAAGAVSGNPTVASAVALAPVAIQLLNSATQITQAGAMTPAQLAALFATIGANLKAAHDQWVNLTTMPTTDPIAPPAQAELPIEPAPVDGAAL
jgi:hypothetical protein